MAAWNKARRSIMKHWNDGIVMKNRGVVCIKKSGMKCDKLCLDEEIRKWRCQESM